MSKCPLSTTEQRTWAGVIAYCTIVMFWLARTQLLIDEGVKYRNGEELFYSVFWPIRFVYLIAEFLMGFTVW